ERDYARQIRQQLEGNSLEYWIDVEDIGLGEEWPQKIDEALKDSYALILVVTPSALKSIYVTYEWIFALGRGIKILPLKFSQISDAELHPKLQVINYYDFTNPTPKIWNKLIDELIKVRAEYDPFDIASKLSPNTPRFVQNALADLEDTNERNRRQ